MQETDSASASCRLKSDKVFPLHSHGVLLKDFGYKVIPTFTTPKGVVVSQKFLPRLHAHAGLCITNSRLLVLQSEVGYVPLGTYPISLCITVSDFTPKVMKYTTYTDRDKGVHRILGILLAVCMKVGLLPNLPKVSKGQAPSEGQSEPSQTGEQS